MRWMQMFFVLFMLAASSVTAAPDAEPKQKYPPAVPDANGRFRGAYPSPMRAMLTAPQHTTVSYPAQYLYVPPKRSMFGNDQYGNCVMAEESENINAVTFAVYGAAGEQVIPTSTVVAYCRRKGTLNGANLSDVMDMLNVSRNDGLVGTDGKMYCIGPYSSVNYTNEDNLRSAISQSPVKLGVDATPFNGSGDGWTVLGGRNYPNEDHAIHVSGYGTPAFIYGLLGKPVPSGMVATQIYYVCYTWSMLFVVDHASLVGFTSEAWLRSPDVYADGVLVNPVTPPPPGPGPNPVPPVNVLSLTTSLAVGQYAIVPLNSVVLSDAEIASLQLLQQQLQAIMSRVPAQVSLPPAPPAVVAPPVVTPPVIKKAIDAAPQVKPAQNKSAATIPVVKPAVRPSVSYQRRRLFPGALVG